MRHEIKNRHGLKIIIVVEGENKSGHLVFIAHGQGGFKEQPHIQTFKKAFLENGYTVVLFDATNSIGESEGDIINVTQTNYLQDLEDVIDWAKKRDWYQEPFALCGHSMGGMSTTLYAEKYPDNVLALVPVSAVINYELSIKGKNTQFLEDWKLNGYYESESSSKPGVMKKIGWGYIEDLKKHNLLDRTSNLTMPVLLVVGDNDNTTPYLNQKLLFDQIPHNDKKLVKVKNADHNFRGDENYDKKLKQIEDEISEWLKLL